MALSIYKKYRALFFDKPENRKELDMIIVHSTNSNNASGTLEWFRNPKNTAQSSAHYVVARDGNIYQMLEEEEVAWHAGKSEWFVDGKPRTNISYYSIGIEVAADENSAYTPEQYDALVDLCKDIMIRRKIKPEMVLRHSDISPKRKRDPYTANLNWEEFKTKINIPVELPPIERHPLQDFEDFIISRGYAKEKKNLDLPISYGVLCVILQRLYEDLTKSK